mmetsp:Transcript_10675/g.28554  ORF Transcript_10675/g.28554 Transcript_10675/m.28554 type:complete len:203 (+) Transcript_10675:95-703(+)
MTASHAIGLGRPQRMLVVAEAMVEQARVHGVRTGGAWSWQLPAALRLRLCERCACALRREHRLHFCGESDDVTVLEEQLAVRHPRAEALHDLLGGVVVGPAIEVPTGSVLVRLLRHLDLEVDVILPAHHGDTHMAGQVHVHDALRRGVVVCLIHELSVGVVPQCAPTLQRVGRWEARQHGLPVNRNGPGLQAPHHDLVIVHE